MALVVVAVTMILVPFQTAFCTWTLSADGVVVVLAVCAANIGKVLVLVLQGSGITVSVTVRVGIEAPGLTAPVHSATELQEPLPPGLVLAGRKVEAKKSKLPIVFTASRPGA